MDLRRALFFQEIDKDHSDKKSKTRSAEHSPSLLASDDSSQHKKRVSFKRSKMQDIQSKNQGKGNSEEIVHVRATKRELQRQEEEDEEMEEWEKGTLRNEKTDKYGSKSKSKDKKKENKKDKKKDKLLDEEKKKKKKGHKKSKEIVITSEAVPTQSEVGTPSDPAMGKLKGRRSNSVHMGDSGLKAEHIEKNKAVSLSTISLLDTSVAKRRIKGSLWDSLSEDLLLRMFRWLDLKSLGTDSQLGSACPLYCDRI